jgi:hypothetical protein
MREIWIGKMIRLKPKISRAQKNKTSPVRRSRGIGELIGMKWKI